MQPFDRKSILIFFILAICLLIGLAIPSFGPSVVTIMVRGAISASIFILLTYSLKIVPEFDSLIPFFKKHRLNN